MSIASDLRSLVTALLQEWGREMTVSRLVEGVYNNDTGETSAPTPALFEGIGRLGSYGDDLINNSNILQGDRIITFVPDDISYRQQTGDVVQVPLNISDVEEHSIVRSKLIEVGGELVSYTFQVRGAPNG